MNKKAISLSKYVKKRTGVPLGASGSMENMLKRSLGAGSFDIFWQFWNPIWSYYLSRFVMKPLLHFLPLNLTIILTFFVSGLVHDIAVTLLRGEISYFITLWFSFMGAVVVVSKTLNFSYTQLGFYSRVIINLLFISLSWLLTSIFLNFFTLS